MKTRSIIFIVTFSIFISFKCSEWFLVDHGNNNPGQPQSGKVVIEASTGGSISLSNGITLDIPANALNQDTEIEIESLTGDAFDQFAIIGAQMQPNGLAFNSPATLILPLPSDWDAYELPAIYEVAGDDPADFFLSGRQAKIAGSTGAYFAEIEVNHFSSLGAARNCHAGSIDYIFNDFAAANCSLEEMEAQIKETYGNRFSLVREQRNGKDELRLHNVPMQCFLNTYFNNFAGFEKGDPITVEFLNTLRRFVERDGRQVVVAFSEEWTEPDNDGIYAGFYHSGVLEIVGGQLKLRQSVSVKDTFIDKVIKEFGENKIYYPQQGELTAELLNEFRQEKSSVPFEEAYCGTPGCEFPQPVEERKEPYQAVRFYVSKYLGDQNPCESGNDSEYTKCQFRVEVSSILQSTTYFNTGATTTGQVNGTVFAGNYTGTFSNNTFTGTRDAVTDNSTLASSITVELDETREVVNRVHVSYYNSNRNFSSDKEFEAVNIPFKSSEADYRVEATPTCDHITLFTNRTAYKDRETNLISFDCVIGNEFIKIYLYK